MMKTRTCKLRMMPEQRREPKRRNESECGAPTASAGQEKKRERQKEGHGFGGKGLKAPAVSAACDKSEKFLKQNVGK